MPDTIRGTRESTLAMLALRFAAGDLPPEQAAEFAERIAVDDDAREALENAFRLSAAALGQAPPAPDPAVRSAVTEEVRHPFLAKWLPHRRYRGHPMAWLGLGGGVAVGLVAIGLWIADSPDDDPAPPASPGIARLEEPHQPLPSPTIVRVVDPHGGPTHTAVVKEMDERSGTMVVELVPDPPPTPPPPEEPEKPGRGVEAAEISPR